MLIRGTKGRRLWLAVALVALGGMAYAGIALASAPIVGTGTNQYTAPDYTINQGEVAQLQVTGSTHNATANGTGPDGKALFRSPTISTGQSAGVDGTQYLSAGTYTFFCTIHPSTMQATLHVSNTGAPLARPSATLALKSKSLSNAIKKGLLVAVTASTKIDGATISAKLGKTTIGKATLSLAAGPQTDRVKLNKAGKSKLRGRSSAKVTLSADIPFGSPASAKAKLK
jgi:plastocyanin